MPFLERDGYRIHYEWAGAKDGPVLMLSHSLGAHRGMWSDQVQALGAHARLLLYDHPGHGRSTIRPTKGCIADYGRDVLALLDALKIEKLSFCGLSLGGMVGLWLASQAGGRLERVVLCDTTAKIEDTRLLRGRLDEIRADGIESICESVLEKWFTPRFRQCEPDRVAQARQMLLTTSGDAYAMTAEVVCDLDLREELKHIAASTLVIYGSEDLATPPAWNLAICEGIRGAEALSVPGGHLSNIESAEEFSAAVLRFVLPSRSGSVRNSTKA
jgi:3-oxoadipate enol-lactonase